MIRINLTGTWTAVDFANFYSSMDYLYTLFVLIDIERESTREWEHFYDKIEPPFKWFRQSRGGYPYFRLLQIFQALRGEPLIQSRSLRRASLLLYDEERLSVRRCDYSSPGFTDFAGLGVALGHLKDFILSCIRLKADLNECTAKVGILEEKRKAAALKNLQAEIEILRNLGYTKNSSASNNCFGHTFKPEARLIGR